MNYEKNEERGPSFHITGGKGWINDPNGLVYFQNKYHVFYQYYPYGTQWGPMHWGHVVSDDLIRWQRLPVALAPGGTGDKNGCFSGSAIVWQDKLWLLYTGFTENEGGESVRQVQCLASSTDGVTFQKYGIVIGEDDLPEEYRPWDFRDPKVWRKDDRFWCVVAAGRRNGRGRILLFCSTDLFQWQFVGDLFGEDCAGTMTECPDYRDDMGLLTVCEQFQPQEGKTHLNIHSTRWYMGKLDYTTGKFTPSNQGMIDYGFDFYASQTFLDQPVMIGWLNMWDRNIPSVKYGFAGMLTLPRKIEVKEGRLWQTPVLTAQGESVSPSHGRWETKIKKGVITIALSNLQEMKVQFRKKGDCYTELNYQDGELILNRSRAGEQIVGAEKDQDSLAGIRRMPLKMALMSEITIVLDEFSVEIFADGNVMSSTIYPPEDADDFILLSTADSCNIRCNRFCS
jgi:beta-fructofuranosidase